MKIVDIMGLVEGHLEIDKTNLASESLSTGSIYGKILRIRTEESIRLNILKGELKKLLNFKRAYYGGKCEPSVYKEKPFNVRLLKNEVEDYAETDDEVVSMTSKLDIQNEKVLYLNDALKMISQRNFQIKSAIDYQKMMNGGY